MSVRRAHFFAVQQPPRNLRGLGGKDAQTLAEHIAAESNAHLLLQASWTAAGTVSSLLELTF